jgi:hypothetical protein
MANWLEYFFGGKSPPQIAPPPPKNADYPTTNEAIDAVKQGYGYGSGNEPYIEGKRAVIYDEPSSFRSRDNQLENIIGQGATDTDLTRFGKLAELDKIRLLHAQAALAANRNPITATGYDPQQIGLQTKNRPTTVAGLYSPEQDRAWVNVANSNADLTPPSTAAHESTHRGLEYMGRDRFGMSDKELALVAEARKLKGELPDEESVVRYIMATQMGNPEQGRGDEADRLRQKALNQFRQKSYYFAGDPTSTAQLPDSINAEAKLRRLEEIAIEQRKNRRPGGPR